MIFFFLQGKSKLKDVTLIQPLAGSLVRLGTVGDLGVMFIHNQPGACVHSQRISARLRSRNV